MEWSNYPTSKQRLDDVVKKIHNFEEVIHDYQEMICAFPHMNSQYQYEINLIRKKLEPLLAYRNKELISRSE